MRLRLRLRRLVKGKLKKSNRNLEPTGSHGDFTNTIVPLGILNNENI